MVLNIISYYKQQTVCDNHNNGKKQYNEQQ